MITRYRKAKLKLRRIPRQRKAAGSKGPNATETRFRRFMMNLLCSDKYEVKYEGVSFDITTVTKRKYTPDWVVLALDGETPVMVFEVKGGYHLPTHERARLAWEIAAERNPDVAFCWAELAKNGWEIEQWYEGGRIIKVLLPGYDQFRPVEADWRRHRPRKKGSSK